MGKRDAEDESGLRHPIHAAEHEAEHLRQIAEEGESAATPAIIGGTVIAFAALTLAVILTLALGIAYLATRGGGGSSGGIKTAPAFSADELSALPTDNWITNGGSLANQRYSPLDKIDVSNISQLKGVWHTHLRGSGLAAKYSAEAQPLVYQGTIYVPTGQDDVFAVNAETGSIRWQYKGNLDQTISTVCCGWLSRGVALGEGKVYIGQLDGNLVALDQKTGAVAWKTLVMPWEQGYSITSAPLYVDGMVITGVSGGEFGIRGRLTAYDAQTGRSGASTRSPAPARPATRPGPRRATPGSTGARPSGRRRRSTRSSGSCTSRRATLGPTTMAASVPARISSPPRWWRST